ncbi:MAG: phenylalanine--tRNA ligase subunit alpha [Candidatus Yonathbacteria bacterium]|nr:phenylalanine--tRNA ligase subunit alpha [Candidatus Yonathbacteria bacterium]
METPKSGLSQGHLHPLTQVIGDVVRIFHELGFEVAEGTEVETEYYNFDALNVPKDHPARDMQDTFWLKGIKETVLRTHTSPVQVHYMEKNKPPFRIVVPGKVFRHEATDATHEVQFYQIEGLVVSEDVSLAHLKGVLELFFKKLFGEKTSIRFRPSFFPFVEPGIEIDVSCFKCAGTGCSLCKKTGFIEVMGAGMVHPNVLNGAGIDSRKYQGFAFGGGVDRLVMLKYGIDDVRLLYSGDLRLVNQF